jgi:hypothetical protein
MLDLCPSVVVLNVKFPEELLALVLILRKSKHFGWLYRYFPTAESKFRRIVSYFRDTNIGEQQENGCATITSVNCALQSAPTQHRL